MLHVNHCASLRLAGYGTRARRLLLAVIAAGMVAPTVEAARANGPDDTPIVSRNIGVARFDANKTPRNEADQTVVDGWPLYRSERGQTAFNDTMATLRATDGPSPVARNFKGCPNLECALALPKLEAGGWLPAGRLWVSPTDYVVIAHSPRLRKGQSYRRRSPGQLKFFVFHEFHNSTRNTDAYDTISSHSGEVFVPFYMSKQGTDAKGRRFVAVIQIAPFDVVSVHATNLDSAGPGIEVAKSAWEDLEPLQATAGALIATILKAAVPRLEVVNHHGTEGLPMLQAYERRLAAAQSRPTVTISLPFVPAEPDRVASATGRLNELIRRQGASAPIPVAERAVIPPRASVRAEIVPPEPKLVRSARLR